VLLLAAWFALGAGLLQSLMFLARWFGLHKPIMQNAQVVWMAPLAYVVYLLPLVLVLALGNRWRPGLVTLRVTVVGFAFFTTWSLLLTLRPQVHGLALLVLAAGTAAQTWRTAGLAAARLVGHARRSVPWLAAVVVVLAAGVNGWQRLAERRALARLPEPAAESPNVLLIILDTVRALSVSLHGPDRSPTPNLARLAEEGAVFDRAIAPAPWTLPSHASIFTGRFPFEVKADWGQPLDDAHPTLAEALRDAGYATGGFTANIFYTSWESGLARGFVHYRDFRVSPGQILRSAGVARLLLGTFTQSRLLRSIGYYEIPGRKRAHHVNHEFLQWLDGLDGRPFFAFLNYFDAHDPYLPPEPFRSRHDTIAIRSTFLQKVGYRLGLLEDPAPPSATSFSDRSRLRYEGSVAWLDDQVGRLLAELDRRGVLDHTVVIVTSDHGEAFNDHGVSGHGKRLYTDQVWVPLLIRYPARVPAGVRVPEPVTLRGIPSTVVDLAGLDRGRRFAGTSLGEYWREGTEAHDTVLSELTRVSGADDERGATRAVVIGGLHYIVRPYDRHEEVYDLAADPREALDLVPSGRVDLTPFRALLNGPLSRTRAGAPPR
jgi:arylsulfatase A-like enzyme